MTKPELATETVDTDAIYFLPRKTIHPDPEQPRVHPDDELQSSIDADGIIQAITVRPHPEIENEWMIVDGERRFIGAKSIKDIPCRIRLDLEEPVRRLITQLAANSGKPLSAIEQARAFKKILDDDPKLSQTELAKRLGIPRTTIGDRIRLIEIHPAWMKLIESGRLQVSHAPLIHQYRAVPDEYQVKAAQKIFEGDGWQIAKYEKGDVISIAAFRDILHAAFKDYVVKLDDVRSYKGPVLEIEEEIWSYGPGPKKLKKVKYAADITLWRPIKREAEKRAKKAREASPHSNYAAGHYTPPAEKAVKALKAAGYDPPLRPVGTKQVLPNEGEAVIFNERGWQKDLHPTVLLNLIDPSTIVYVKGNFGGDQLFTSDVAAVDAARKAYLQHVAEISKKELAPLRAKLTPAVLEKYAVRGAGAPPLLMSIVGGGDWRGSPKVIALAIGLAINGPVDEEMSEDDDDAILTNDSVPDAEKLLSAIAAVAALELKVPNEWEISQKINKGLDVPFKVQAKPYISKTRAKKMARAAGKQVGDPDRAPKNVDVGEIRAAVEAGENFDEEEEFEEANA